ncbi:hypothetical protein WDW37_17670 [Bdellovibrionota bacterium FG-1]
MISQPRLIEFPGCNPDCRACHYKEFDYATQLVRKQQWAQAQFEPWGSVLAPLVPAPPQERLHYRTKSWLRAKFSDGPPADLSFGMLRSVRAESGKWDKELISWNECPIHHPAIHQALKGIRAALCAQAPEFARSLAGVWIGIPHLVFVSSAPAHEALQTLNWREILAPPFENVWFHCNPQVGRKIFGHHEMESVFSAATARATPHHPIRAFRQVATTLLKQARHTSVTALIKAKPSAVLDLYCGTGELSQLIPETTGWLGIECSKDAVTYARSLKPPGRALHEAFIGTVEDRLRDPRVVESIPHGFALYVNPPRTGLGSQVLSLIQELSMQKQPTVLAYLSCSASSLARDLKVLEATGWRVETLASYDFFPQTEHFETLAILKR